MPVPNVAFTNGVEHDTIDAHERGKPDLPHSNGIVNHELNGATAPDLAFDSIEDTITAFSSTPFDPRLHLPIP